MFSFLTSLNPHDILAAAGLVSSAIVFIVHKIGKVQHRVLIDDINDRLQAVEGGNAPTPASNGG